MLRVTSKVVKQKSKHPLYRFPGIGADADALGVTRQHLYLVLIGQRQSISLMKKYRRLHRSAA